MPNPVTDQLDMVNTTTVHGGSWLFPKSVRIDQGFSQQVFKASGEYRGSVDDPATKIPVRDGEIVLRVNLGVKELALKGTLHTRDGYTRAYEGIVLIRVTKPAQFAIAYRQGVDPAGSARTLIDGDLTRWASDMKHDEIAQEMLRYRTRHALDAYSPTLGLGVASVEKLIAYADPVIAERIDIEHKDQITRTQDAIGHRRREDERGEHAKDRALARDQAAQDDMTKFQLDAKKRVVTAIVDAHMRQLQDLLQQGYTLEEINRDRPDLMPLIAELADFTPRQYDALGGGSGTAAAGSSDGEVRSNLLGVRLKEVPLTPDQQESLGAQPIAVEKAYQIIRVDQDGPAARAALLTGDILISQSPLLLTVAAPDANGLRAAPPTSSAVASFDDSVRQELKGQAKNVAGFVEVFGGSFAGSVDVGNGIALASGAINALHALASQHFVFSQQTAYFKALWDGTLQSNQVAIYIFFFQLSTVCANH